MVLRPIPDFRKARICECGEHGFLGLTKGFVAFISPHRVQEVAQYRWAALVASCHIYAISAVRGRSTPLHRYLTKAPDGLVVDHRDGESLNNRDDNLRLCTQSQNKGNTRHAFGEVPLRGVSKRRGRFEAKISLGTLGRRHLGIFDCPIDAARAYDAAALERFGPFAATNAALGLLPEIAA